MEPTVEGGREPDRKTDLSDAWGQHPTAVDTEPEDSSQSAAEAVDTLERTIEHFESVLGTLEQRSSRPGASAEELAALRHELTDVLFRVDDGLKHLSAQALRLAEGASDLASVSSRLEGRLADLATWVASAESPAPAPELLAPEPEPLLRDFDELDSYQPPPVQQEPQFWQGDLPVGVLISGVPGFQGLMDVQRGMGVLPAVESASVVGYKNGEASLEVALRDPISAREIVDGLRAATGHQLVIEEAHPETLRLRLRFVDGQSSMISGGSLRAEFRSGSSSIG